MSLNIAIALGLVVSATAALHAQGPAGGGDEILRAGDAVRVSVWRKPEMSGEFVIAPDGGLRHPLYRGVTVGGVAVSVAEARLRTYLATLEERPQFVFEPLFRVLVAGEVEKPGVLLLDQGTLVVQAVAIAGGPSERARTDHVRLLRDGQVITVDLTQPEQGPAQMGIRSGDQIFVDRRSTVFRDYVLPMISIAGAAAAILNVFLRD
jgi:polysaccharide export outer membrane protein